MELKYFRLIKTIADEGNIVNSSDKLYLTQSALSHQLRELEESLGFKVFHRKRNDWQLTNEGKELYILGNQIFEQLDKGFHKIKAIKNGSTGKIRISAECHSFFHNLPMFIQKMGLLYPEIQTELNLGTTHQTVNEVLSDQIEVAIMATKPESDQLHVIELFTDEMFVLMHKEHFLANKKHLDSSDFTDMHLYINSFPLENVSIYEKFLKPNKVKPSKVTAIPFTEISIELIKANMGVICLPKWALNPFKLSSDLLFKQIGKNGLKRTHYLVIKESNKSKLFFSNFLGQLREEFIDH